MSKSETQDVVVRRLTWTSEDGWQSADWGRDTKDVATEFCRRPKYPAKLTDHFVGVDDWGHGEIVCATPSFSNWIGTPWRQFKAEVTR